MISVVTITILLLLLHRVPVRRLKRQRVIIHKGEGYIQSRPFRYGKHGGVIR